VSTTAPRCETAVKNNADDVMSKTITIALESIAALAAMLAAFTLDREIRSRKGPPQFFDGLQGGGTVVEKGNDRIEALSKTIGSAAFLKRYLGKAGFTCGVLTRKQLIAEGGLSLLASDPLMIEKIDCHHYLDLAGSSWLVQFFATSDDRAVSLYTGFNAPYGF